VILVLTDQISVFLRSLQLSVCAFSSSIFIFCKVLIIFGAQNCVDFICQLGHKLKCQQIYKTKHLNHALIKTNILATYFVINLFKTETFLYSSPFSCIDSPFMICLMKDSTLWMQSWAFVLVLQRIAS